MIKESHMEIKQVTFIKTLSTNLTLDNFELGTFCLHINIDNFKIISVVDPMNQVYGVH